jgi:hypothetical protein
LPRHGWGKQRAACRLPSLFRIGSRRLAPPPQQSSMPSTRFLWRARR